MLRLYILEREREDGRKQYCGNSWSIGSCIISSNAIIDSKLQMSLKTTHLFLICVGDAAEFKVDGDGNHESLTNNSDPVQVFQ